MSLSIVQVLFLLESLIFICAVFLHVVKHSASLIYLYMLQSLAVACIFIILGFEDISARLLLTALFTILIKVVLAPRFFSRLLNRHQIQTSGSTYLNTPVTLAMVVIILILSQIIFTPLTSLALDLKYANQAVIFAGASLFVSAFLLINRRGVLSQIIGILSFENSIVSFVSFIGFEQAVGFELAILFDVFISVIAATFFISMIYGHFESLESTIMRHLKD